MERRNRTRTSATDGRSLGRRIVATGCATGLLLMVGCTTEVDAPASSATSTVASVADRPTTTAAASPTHETASTTVPSTGAAIDGAFRVVDADELCDVVPTSVIADRVGLDVLDTMPYSGSVGYTDTITMQTGCTFELSGDNDLSFAVVHWDDRRPFDSAGFAQLRDEQDDAEDDPFPDDQPFEEVDSLGVPAFFVPTDTRNRLYIDTGVQVLCVAGGTFEITLERPRIVAAAAELLDALRTD